MKKCLFEDNSTIFCPFALQIKFCKISNADATLCRVGIFLDLYFKTLLDHYFNVKIKLDLFYFKIKIEDRSVRLLQQQ